MDQFTKFLAVEHLKGKPSFVIIKNVFELSYLENKGAAFGILQNQRCFLLLVSVFVITIIFMLYIKIPTSKTIHSASRL